ncbi:MAG: UDP-N-acetylmuramate dehydrogenase [Epsilonproteobacteria bacterium]|nr:UDP-N-acetylmuramate dehydrogenase [Campylobacterota bacterium]
MNIEKKIPLNDKNWFRTGGNARYFAQPQSEQEMQQALRFAHESNSDIFLLGQGANILMSDEGFGGLVLRPQLNNITFDKATGCVRAGAGVCMQRLIEQCLDNQLIGLEDFSGIPGTVGGSMFINIHYFQFLLSDFLVSARVIDKQTGQVGTVEPAWFNFGYNQSTLQKRTHYLLDATFQLTPVDPLQAAYARGRRDEIIKHRNRRYPLERTCGSFFRNFADHELPFEVQGKKIPYVAYYLDKVGVRGALSFGGAAVSAHHANMIVTREGATSADVIGLARLMQQKVFDTFGIVPQPECLLVGFGQYPLWQPVMDDSSGVVAHLED